jgi:trehalose 6-phosphate phosphatase
MRVLSPAVDPDAFFEKLARAHARVLLLDYDGTLAPFAVRPERAFPYPGVGEELERLMDGGGTRVVIVSGRKLDDLVPLLPWRRRPELWGTHGWERLLPDGSRHVAEPGEEIRGRLAQAEERAHQLFTQDGARVEVKPAAVALHWRGLPALAVAKVREGAQRAWGGLADSGGLELLGFDGGLELRAAGCDKRHAVETVLSETPGEAAVAYLGDDLTDEDAFAAVKPRGLAVLVRPELRETRADLWIRPPRELLAFFRRWRERCAAA